MASKADPAAIYPKLREHMMNLRVPGISAGSVHAVLMDWPIPKGMITVLAGADGAASIYLSSGGGFIGGGQKPGVLQDSAKRAVDLATALLPEAAPVESRDLPPAGTVYFWITTGESVRRVAAQEDDLKKGKPPASALGAAMQAIITAYRHRHST
ncbi:MAG TPA: hypothetical protein VGN16_06675 [Acidobacteriaceae bacterium]|jgi:hypothetical protein